MNRGYKGYDFKIISMMPPGKWAARFDGHEGLVPMVGWALIERNNSTEIKGMIVAEYGQILPCDCFENFLCYEPTEVPISAV